MTEVKADNGKLYVSAIFDCFDFSVIGLSIDTNKKTSLCVQTLRNAYKAYPSLKDAVIHNGRRTPYSSRIYRNAVSHCGIQQSMNSAGGRCYDNARCESMRARMKSELLYERYKTERMTPDELKALIGR